MSDGSPPLEYASGGPDPEYRRRVRRWFVKGLTLSLLVGAASFGLLFLAGAENFEDSPPGVWSVVGLIVAPLALGGMLVLAVRARRSKVRPGFAAGLFLGLGLSALPVGLCYTLVAGEVMR